MAEGLEFEIKFYEDILEKSPDFIEALIALGDAYTKNKQYEEGLKVDEKLSKLKPQDATIFYNLACSYSLTNRMGFALNALEKAIRLGYSDFSYMDTDPDLENLRKEQRYRELLKSKNPLI